MTAKQALAAFLTLLSAGCTLGPDFKAPDAPAAQAYSAPGEHAATTVDAGPGEPKQVVAFGDEVTAEWWRLFRSEALDRLVKDAVAGNLTLESAKARLDSARQTVLAAASALYPQADFKADAQRGKVTMTAFGLKPGIFPLPPNYNSFQLGPQIGYSLDLFGGIRRKIEQQAALANVQLQGVAAAYLTLTGNAVAQALQLAAARAEIAAIDDILALDRKTLDLVRLERRAGEAPDTDVVSAESQLAADETLRPAPEQRISLAAHAIAVLSGRAPDALPIPDFDLAALTLPETLPVALPSALVHRRPDILTAEARLHAASAAIGVATARLYPDVTLSANLSVAALDPGHLFNTTALAWSIAAGLTQPIFDGGLREAERDAALADFKAASADYQQTVLEAFAQIADLLQALLHDADLLAAQKRAMATASEALRLQKLSYSGGHAGIIELLDAERQYHQARIGYVRAEAQRYRDTAQLFVATGGGWWKNPPDQTAGSSQASSGQ